MRISVEEVIALRTRLQEIEAPELQDIEWTVGGEIVAPTEKQIDDWRFTGLCNRDFITNDLANPFATFVEIYSGIPNQENLKSEL